MPSKSPGQRLMKRSIADPANLRRVESVSAASENLAEPAQPPIEIVSLRCG